MKRRPAQLHNIVGSAIEYLPPYPGGVCETLPAPVYIKYFQAGSDQPPERRAAKAMCAQCPVRELCLEQIINSGPVKRRGGFIRIGIVGGMTMNQIYRIQMWEAYDRGLRPTQPPEPRVDSYKSPTTMTRAASSLRLRRPPGYTTPRPEPKVTVTDLSFEERVYLIFREVKEGKYKTLNDAVRDIAAMHHAALLREERSKS